MTVSGQADLTASIAGHLPYLRRYARALTGNQTSGDTYAIATLEAVLADPSVISIHDNHKVALFAVLHTVWAGTGAPVSEGGDTPLGQAAQAHLARLTPNSREALLLSTIEGFSVAEVAKIIDASQEEASGLIERAVSEMADSVAGTVMIIEDEAVIAMDLSAIIEEMGHDVTGIARTRTEAVALATRSRPDLILADIQLADNSSGVDAVNDILKDFPNLPVIFITAFPQRLLTGERPEPAFLINKPYTDEQVRSAVSQAMFFASTESLVN